MVHQNLAHGCTGHCKEMAAILKRRVLSACQFQISLIEERSWLESVALVLANPGAPRHTMQFVVNKRHQLIECVLVALAPGGQQVCHLTLRIHVSGSRQKSYSVDPGVSRYKSLATSRPSRCISHRSRGVCES